MFFHRYLVCTSLFVQAHQWTQLLPPERLCTWRIREHLCCLQSDAGGWTLGVVFCGRESCFHWLKHKLCSLSLALNRSDCVSPLLQPPPRSLLAFWRSPGPDAELLPSASAVQQQLLRLDRRSSFTGELLHAGLLFWGFTVHFFRYGASWLVS